MERKIKRFVHIGILVLSLLLFVVFLLPYFGGKVVYAEGETHYSNVLDDLKKDDSFSMEYYPEVSLENTEGETDDDKKTNYARIELIQIAESVDKELFVYVYQPSGQTLDLRANYISLSTEPKENIEPKIYKLKFLNSNETIYKYVVEDFTVLSDDVRYYGIVELFRPFNENYDKGTDNDNTVNSVSYKVAKQYRYGLVNGEYSVQVTEMETIMITEKYVGFCRYPAGHNLFNIDLEKACDAHFVAFDTDKPIDRLVSATVFYTSQSFSKTTATFAEPTIKYGEAVDSEPLKIDGEKVSYTGDGLWAGTYEWIRIETVEDFIANEERNDVYEHGLLNQEITTKLSKGTLEQNLDGKKWVLRFLETDYLYDQTNTPYVTTQHVEYTIVSNVSILQLEFWTNGIYYNLGVVDNMQSGDLNPDNEVTQQITINTELLQKILAVLLVLLLVVLLVALCSVITPIGAIVKAILKAIAWVISAILWVLTLPFRLLAKLFKRR